MGILRLWLAVAVAIGHAGPGVLPFPLDGNLAVSCFYVISGFYIQLIIRENYSGKRHWVANFYKSRALRIYPLYYFFTIVSLPFALQSDNFREAVASGNVWTLLYMVWMNLFIFGQEIARFLTLVNGALVISWPLPLDPHFLSAQQVLTVVGIGQSWSLAVEFWFYLVAPLLLLRRTRTVVAILVCSLAVRGLIEFSFGDGTWTRWWNHFFPSELATFLAGSLGYRFYAGYWTGRWRGWGFLALILYYSVTYPDFRPYHVATSYFGAIVLVALALPFLFSASRHSRIDRFIGELSYPVYLNHFLFVQLLTTFTSIQPKWYSLIVVPCSILLAIPMVILVEEPLARYRHFRFARKRTDGDLAPAAPTTGTIEDPGQAGAPSNKN